MNYIIVAISNATYQNACSKLSLDVNEKIKEGYVPHGNMHIVYDNQKYLWQASQAMILVK